MSELEKQIESIRLEKEMDAQRKEMRRRWRREAAEELWKSTAPQRAKQEFYSLVDKKGDPGIPPESNLKDFNDIFPNPAKKKPRKTSYR